MAFTFDHTTAGVDFYTVTSAFITETTALRVCAPTAPAAVPHRTLFVLPVKPGLSTEFGDGLTTLQTLNAHNAYNCTLVAPSFPTEPWMGDNPGNTGRRYESFILELRAWCDATLPAAAQTWGLSFSKGGVSVLHLMLRNPAVFDRGAAWDPPTALPFTTGTNWEMEEAYGTAANYLTNYQPNSIVETVNLSPFTSTPRIWMSGDLVTAGGAPTNYNSQVFALATALQTHAIPVGWMSGHTRVHRWDSGWLVDAMAWLAAPVAADVPIILFPRPDLVQLVHLLFPDTSASGNTVTNLGTSTAVTTAPLAAGMTFGTDPTVGPILQQPSTNGLDFGPAFVAIDGVDKSFFARVRVTTFGPAHQTIVSKEDTGVLGYAVLLTPDGHLHYHVTDGVDVVDTGASVPLATWCTLGVTWDAVDQEVSFYVNGLLQSQQAVAPGAASEGSTLSEALLIGKSRNQSLFPFNGDWANVQIYSGILSATDLLNLHETGTLEPPPLPEPAPSPLPPPPGVAVPVMLQRGALLTRLLGRLPASLWDTDPTAETVQRDLYAAVAAQATEWLENRDIARTMTLLREAQGVDLDTLLADYGLKRYLQRPDAYARQIGMQILWTPKGTEHSVSTLADLLFEAPHVTLRTGRGHTHVFVALTQPVTTPYSYWGLVAQDTGTWYAVTVDGTVPTISLAPPSGQNVAPGPHTLSYFTVLDGASQPWYVTIRGDTLHLAQVLPSGYGTAEPFRVLDGQGTRWTLRVDAGMEALVSLPDLGVTTFGYWRVRDADTGTATALWIEGRVPTLATSAPAGVDQTPGGTPLDWVQASDETGVVWYVHVEDDTLVTSHTGPGGSGTSLPVDLMDAGGTLWRLTIQSGTEAVVTTTLRSPLDDVLVLSPGHPYEAVRLVDSAGVSWWYTIQAGAAIFLPALPSGAHDITPAGGPYRWLRLFDLDGTSWYVSPSTSGTTVTATTAPSGLGTATPQALGDVAGVVWQLGITAGSTVGTSSTPAVDYGGLATAVCLNDALGNRWFWRVRGGRLEWSAFLWPDTIDQSPWGELGWLQMTTTTAATVYVYPTLVGSPTAASAPPHQSPWGWQDPITLVDTEGAHWHLVVMPTTVGAPEYWQVHDETGTVAYLWIEASVPTTQATVPAGGSDQTPGLTPLETFAVKEDSGRQVWVTLEHDTLVLSLSRAPGVVGTEVPFDLQDALGQVWYLDARQGTEALRTTLSSHLWRVRVAADPLPTIPPPATPLALRDAVEALAHLQAAGGLVTVRVN